jgi:hypothetical protein
VKAAADESTGPSLSSSSEKTKERSECLLRQVLCHKENSTALNEEDTRVPAQTSD